MTAKSKLKPSADIQRVPLELLELDAANIRKKYNMGKLTELASSLMEHGQLQNLECGPAGVVHLGNRRLKALKELVVPRLEKDLADAEAAVGDAMRGAPVEVQAGAQDLAGRLRARLAELSNPNVLVLTEEQAADAKLRQVVENLQREDVSAWDEAVGFAMLLEQVDAEGEPLHTPESIARRIGKGHDGRYVRERLKVGAAPESMLVALEAGEIGVQQCLMVGRIPNKKLRAEAAKQVLTPQYDDRPLTVAATAELLRENYMVSLVGAPFDVDDASLVPGAPPCSECVYRSGNDPDLAGDLQVRGRGKNAGGVSADVCTNPACFREKGDAAWRVTEASAAAEGKGVLSASEAEEVFCGYKGEMAHNSKYVDLAGKPGFAETGSYDKSKSKRWGVLLKDSGIRVILARHPVTGRLHELVEREAARVAVDLAAAGRGEPSVFLEATENRAAQRRERERERRQRRLARRCAIAVFDALADAMSEGVAAGGPPGGHLHRGALLLLLERTLGGNVDGAAFFGQWMELEKPDGYQSGYDFVRVIMERVEDRDKGYSPGDLAALVALAAIAPDVWAWGARSSALGDFCAVYGVEIPPVVSRVEAAARAEEKEAKKKTAKKKAGKGKK